MYYVVTEGKHMMMVCSLFPFYSSFVIFPLYIKVFKYLSILEFEKRPTQSEESSEKQIAYLPSG